MNEDYSPGGQTVCRINGPKIKAIRERKDLTQLYVATVVGVTTDTISRWENRRYPTIKQENALKLAEILEVDIAEILDPESGETTIDSGQRADKKKKSFTITIIATVIAISLGAAFILKPKKVNVVVPATIVARRILPDHIAPGKPFPVIIKINVSPPGQYSMIVREEVPPNCLALKGNPPLTNIGGKRGTLKWIGKITGQASFSYLAQTDSIDASVNIPLTFSGSVTLKKGQESKHIDIMGDTAVNLKKLHWADANGDYRIDDEEILAIYDQLEAMTELGDDSLQSGVEDIWAASGYRWDESTGEFVIIP